MWTGKVINQHILLQENHNKKDELNDKLREHFKDIVFFYKSHAF